MLASEGDAGDSGEVFVDRVLDCVTENMEVGTGRTQILSRSRLCFKVRSCQSLLARSRDGEARTRSLSSSIRRRISVRENDVKAASSSVGSSACNLEIKTII